MGQKLLIVESPSKAKSITKYLGGGWVVKPTFGHVVDLVGKSGSVDPDDNFKMVYKPIERNKDKLKDIINSAKGKEAIYLASDPDREGEAISWHVQNELLKKLKPCPPIYRVTFHEVSEKAVKEAIANPREIDMNLVNAQQARRALDYLVGFTLSPLLWNKVRPNLSAGRVQSPILRLIVEREKEIVDFVPKEYWSIKLKTSKSGIDFTGDLFRFSGKNIGKQDISSSEEARKLVDALKGKKVTVDTIKKKKVSQSPYAPFTTSTLQQDGVRKLNMSTDRIMSCAQRLYENGIITYHRTDATALSEDTIVELRKFVSSNFPDGQSLLPGSPIVYKSKAKNAQEAHEAVRPVNYYLKPEDMRGTRGLTDDEYRVYKLIWKRTIACQMKDAIFDATSVEMKVGDGVFRANGKVLVFKGFLAVYDETKDIEEEDENDKSLPEMSEGDDLPNKDIVNDQHFTKPPPKFNEASIVKTLDEYGIGRPSTYAPTMKLLKDKEYVSLAQKRMTPTDTGDALIGYLTSKFGQYVDYTFTSDLENKLDDIANGKVDWLTVMNEFWKPFNEKVTAEKADGSSNRGLVAHTEEKCPECSKNLDIKIGKYGKYYSCSGYPECRYSRNLGEKKEKEPAEVVEGMKCPECSSDMVKRKGRYGEFISCSNYPSCKHIHSDKPKAEKTGEKCPKCKKGELLIRIGRRGKFKACNQFPRCKHIENID